MKKGLKYDVYTYMLHIDTRIMNSNEFILGFIEFSKGVFNKEVFLKFSSTEGITRARRYWIENRSELFGRKEESRDSEKTYKEEFSPNYNLQYKKG